MTWTEQKEHSLVGLGWLLHAWEGTADSGRLTRFYKTQVFEEINSEDSLEGLMLKLKLQYFGHLMQRADSLGKTLILGKIEGKRQRGQQRMRWLDGTIKSMDMNLSKFRKLVKDRETCCGVAKSQTWLSDWATATKHKWSQANGGQQFSQFSSVAQLCLTLRPHESQHARPPCPSPTPGVHSDSRPSSQWCHPAISSSVVPFSSCPQSLSGAFK